MTALDHLVIGSGTAGCIVAARLAEDPAVSIRRWAEMLEGEYRLDYRSVPQERGNSGIRQARLRILGGGCTANTMISWRPRVADLQERVDLGLQAGTPPGPAQPRQPARAPARIQHSQPLSADAYQCQPDNSDRRRHMLPYLTVGGCAGERLVSRPGAQVG